MIPVLFFSMKFLYRSLSWLLKHQGVFFFPAVQNCKKLFNKKECPYAFLSIPEQKMDILLNEHQLIEITQHTQYLRK